MRARREFTQMTTAVAVAVILGGCLKTPPAPVPEPEPSIPAFPAEIVWTTAADVVLQTQDSTRLLKRPFTRLEVIGFDSVGLRVRCDVCDAPVAGWVAPGSVVYDAAAPDLAAWGSLAEFVLSVRTAARRRDLEALRPIMADEFTFSFVGIQNPDAAFAVWRSEDFATLDRVPVLLDEGLAPVAGRIWAAPPAFAEELNYRDLRAGFRQRENGSWEWIYLVRGIL